MRLVLEYRLVLGFSLGLIIGITRFLESGRKNSTKKGILDCAIIGMVAFSFLVER